MLSYIVMTYLSGAVFLKAIGCNWLVCAGVAKHCQQFQVDSVHICCLNCTTSCVYYESSYLEHGTTNRMYAHLVTALYLELGSTDLSGKFTAMWWPISAFVTIGFEHSIANSFFIPLGRT